MKVRCKQAQKKHFLVSFPQAKKVLNIWVVGNSVFIQNCEVLGSVFRSVLVPD